MEHHGKNQQFIRMKYYTENSMASVRFYIIPQWKQLHIQLKTWRNAGLFLSVVPTPGPALWVCP